eukprot:1154559-Pelagomonas_calceolata.AAC.8
MGIWRVSGSTWLQNLTVRNTTVFNSTPRAYTVPTKVAPVTQPGSWARCFENPPGPHQPFCLNSDGPKIHLPSPPRHKKGNGDLEGHQQYPVPNLVDKTKKKGSHAWSSKFTGVLDRMSKKLQSELGNFMSVKAKLKGALKCEGCR